MSVENNNGRKADSPSVKVFLVVYVLVITRVSFSRSLTRVVIWNGTLMELSLEIIT